MCEGPRRHRSCVKLTDIKYFISIVYTCIYVYVYFLKSIKLFNTAADGILKQQITDMPKKN